MPIIIIQPSESEKRTFYDLKAAIKFINNRTDERFLVKTSQSLFDEISKNVSSHLKAETV